MASQTVYFNNPADITTLQSTTSVLSSTIVSMSGAISTQILPTVVIYNNNFTAQAGYKYLWVPTGTLGAVNVSLPSSPVSGDTIQIVDGNSSFIGGPYGSVGISSTNYTGTTITTVKGIIGDITASTNSSTGALWPFKSGLLTLNYDGVRWVSHSNCINQTEIVGNPLGSVPIPTISGVNPSTGRTTFTTTASQNASYPQASIPNYVSLYAESPAIAAQSEYIQSNLHIGDLCDCNTLQVRGEIYSDYNQNLAIRGGISIEPGSHEETAQGLDGGFTFTDPTTKGQQQYKTQVIDGIVTTRKILPRSIKPTVSDTNIILNINDGAGANAFWLSKVCADAAIKHSLFRNDITGASYDYFSLGLDGNGNPIRPSTLDQFKLPWEKSGNYDFYLNYQPVGQEHVYQSNYPEPNNFYSPVETDRHKMYESVAPSESSLPTQFTSAGINYGQANVQNTVSYIDSANSAWGMSTGRINGQNLLANTSFTNAGFDSYGATANTNPLTSGNAATTYASVQTITELCKSYGKATCVATTSDPLHATPAAFGTKSQHRSQYTQNARYMFSPLNGSVRPDLVVGALPNMAGRDAVNRTNPTSPNTEQYYFPEIDSSWSVVPTGAAVKDSGAALLTSSQIGTKTCSIKQYAKYYGYNVYEGSTAFSDATGTYGGQLAKVFVLLNDFAAAPGFVSGTLKNGLTGGIGSNYGYSTGAGFRIANCYVDNAPSGLFQYRQKDTIAGCKRILASQTAILGNKGYFMMYENAQTDWGGHSSDALQSGFELIENSLGMHNSYFTGTSSNPKDLIIATTDHEVGGFTFGTTGAPNMNLISSTGTTENGQLVKACPTGCQWLDINDSMNVAPAGFWNRYIEYEGQRKVALALNFMCTPLSFALKDGTQSSYTLSNTPSIYNTNNGSISVQLATGSYNATSPLSGNYLFSSISGYQGTGGSSVSNYRDWFAENVSADQSTGPLVDYLPCHIVTSDGQFKLQCRVKLDSTLPGKIVLMQSAFDNALYKSTAIGTTSTGTVPVNFLTTVDFANDKLIIFPPVSLLGRWFANTNPFGSDASNDQFMTDFLQGNYSASLLFKNLGYGSIVDSDDIMFKLMLDKYFNNALGGGRFANGAIGFGTAAVSFPNDGALCAIHRRTTADLCSYYDPVDGKVTVYAQVGSTLGEKTSAGFASLGAIAYASNPTYHSLSTSALWAKAPPSYADYDISVSGGSLLLKNFLNNKTITQAGIRKLMDGTI